MRTFAVLVWLTEPFQTSLLAQFPVAVAKTHVQQIEFRLAVARFTREKLVA